MTELKIVIAEDTEVISSLLGRKLSAVDGLKVVGIARDGVRAVDLVRQLKPHVLILDISMPRKDGIQALKEIRATDSSTVIIMFTADPAPLIRHICLKAGANYFLDKAEMVELVEICKTRLLAVK